MIKHPTYTLIASIFVLIASVTMVHAGDVDPKLMKGWEVTSPAWGQLL